MAHIKVSSQAQQNILATHSTVVRVRSETQRIVVNPATRAVTITQAGPQGPRGLQGPPGEDGTAQAYIHNQAALSTSWVVNHNLNFRPSVDVFDTNGIAIEGHLIHHTDDQLEIQFLQPRAGTARLS